MSFEPLKHALVCYIPYLGCICCDSLKIMEFSDFHRKLINLMLFGKVNTWKTLVKWFWGMEDNWNTFNCLSQVFWMLNTASRGVMSIISEHYFDLHLFRTWCFYTSSFKDIMIYPLFLRVNTYFYKYILICLFVFLVLKLFPGVLIYISVEKHDFF